MAIHSSLEFPISKTGFVGKKKKTQLSQFFKHFNDDKGLSQGNKYQEIQILV